MNTIQYIAVLLGLPESTLRVYRDEFEEYLPASGEGRRRRYGSDTTELLRRVVEWKREGWTTGQIRDELAKQNQPGPKARRRNTDERLDEMVALLTAQAGEIALLRVEVGTLRAEIKRLIGATKTELPPALEAALLQNRNC